jgi:hypothetical protein
MRRMALLAGFLAATGMTQATPAAENLLGARFNFVWPRDLLHTDKPTAFDVGLNYGIAVDRIFDIGAGVDFLWNRTVDEVRVDTVAGADIYEVTRKRQSYMFPVYVFIGFDPISKYRVHPAGTFSIGDNSMVYSYDDQEELTSGKAADNDPDGYYFGLYMKLALDALVNIGENSALFAGVDYQWADTRSSKTEGNTYWRRDMGGVGVRLGIKAYIGGQ